ncbi:MAG: helix-turn-helix domain-containing protein [Xanthobacteraceae bacterium]
MAMSASPTTATQAFHRFAATQFTRSATTFPLPRNVSVASASLVPQIGTPPTSSDGSLAEFFPANAVERRSVTLSGIVIEFVTGAGNLTLKSQIKGSRHVLIAYEHGLRADGETSIQGLPKSSTRDLTHKLSFVPAGHEYRERHDPLFDLSAIYIYFDPADLNDPTGLTANTRWSPPRLMFEDSAIWDTVAKIKAAANNTATEDCSYVEALGLVLAHEIMRTGSAAPAQEAPSRGGLAPWQQRKITAYIEEHYAEHVTLATMADLVDLSPFYFCRAFKQSFGVPPRRYLARRRIERAKQLLIEHKQSVTHIALEVGFDETSSFSAAFRKATGITPTNYQRSASQ